MKAKILVVIPYTIYPPIGGGALRCFYLLRALAAAHEVYLLTEQPASSFHAEAKPVFPPAVTVISLAEQEKMKTYLNWFLPEKLADTLHTWHLWNTVKGKRNEFLLKAYPVLKQVTKETRFNAVLYENLESLAWLSNLWRRFPYQPLQFFDAHNVDSSLWLQYAKIKGSGIPASYARNALATEKCLSKKIDYLFTCSQLDLEALQKLNNGALTGMVVPNGVDTAQKPFDENPLKCEIRSILFCGTLSVPANREGLLWFYHSIFPKLKQMLPEVKLVVVGQGGEANAFDPMKADDTVKFVGFVSEVKPYYRQCSVAIVPLLSGSGTRLKILEAMSMGNPVVSTTKGAEGIEFENGRHLLIADDAGHFAEQIKQLLTSRNLFLHLQREGADLVHRKYDWRTIGQQMSEKIRVLTT